MPIDPRELFKTAPKVEEPAPTPLGGTRAERIQRLQVGGFGLAAMVLMVALADIVISRARETEAASVSRARLITISASATISTIAASPNPPTCNR